MQRIPRISNPYSRSCKKGKKPYHCGSKKGVAKNSAAKKAFHKKGASKKPPAKKAFHKKVAKKPSACKRLSSWGELAKKMLSSHRVLSSLPHCYLVFDTSQGMQTSCNLELLSLKRSKKE